MTHNAAAWAAALMLVAVCESLGAARERSAREAADGPCAQANVIVEEQHQKVVVSFSNRCAAKVSCVVSWSVRCGKGATEAKSDRVSIDGHSESQLEATALHCGDGDWRITPPRWRCDEPSAPVEELSAQRSRRRR